jgi:hypothetical protein
MVELLIVELYAYTPPPEYEVLLLIRQLLTVELEFANTPPPPEVEVLLLIRQLLTVELEFAHTPPPE